MFFPVDYLWQASSTAAGKFYIGVHSASAPLTLWGPNNAAGQLKILDSVADVDAVITKKKRDYNVVPPSDISERAIDRMVREICKMVPHLDGKQYELTPDGIRFSTAGRSPLPRRQKTQAHFWI